MDCLPALVTSSDLLPGQGVLNGRRWVGHALLHAWGKASGSRPLALAAATGSLLPELLPGLRAQGFHGDLHHLGLLDPAVVIPWGGLFLPDPSIGRWAHWRRPVGAAAFSLIGQIHTLSTPAAIGYLQDLCTEPLNHWDALICSSTAGKSVVEALIDDREQQLLSRTGGNREYLRQHRPQLPVIPLPVPVQATVAALPAKLAARQALGISPDAAVVLWLGRLSFLTKLDPWPGYQLLERVACQLKQSLVFIECGPDDTPEQAEQLQILRQLVPHVKFLRLGGAEGVTELVKHQALAAADVALSLVDNTQETFGLSLVEAMAAGLPIVASDWDGYRDLVRHGIDGFLVPSQWASSAAAVSFPLAWQQLIGLQSYPAIAGAFAQLVQIDLAFAETALLCLLLDRKLSSAMGNLARKRALACFDAQQVMQQYEALFAELADRRATAPSSAREPARLPLALDPVTAFSGFASAPPAPPAVAETADLDNLPMTLRQARHGLWQILLNSSPEGNRTALLADLLRKHQWPA